LKDIYDPTQPLLFLGGGGGGGHQNNGASNPAGNGGGIVILIAPELEVAPGRSYTIDASGADAQDHNLNDGASGGGGGGTIFLDIPTLSRSQWLTLNVSGGDGATIKTRDQHGPGGGGGGGLVRTVYGVGRANIIALGGQPGLFITRNNNNPLQNTPHGAEAGLEGGVIQAETSISCPLPPFIDLDYRIGGTYSRTALLPSTSSGRVFPDVGQVTLTDEDDEELESVSFVLVNAQNGTEEFLGIGWPSDSLARWGLTMTYDSLTYTLDITGTASLATYLKAIQRLYYGNRAENPSLLDREIEATAFDGLLFSNTATAFVEIDQIVLPVEWLSFEASWQQGVAHLRWSTARETNSQYFVVERGDGPSGFARVGEVNAAGTTTEISQYQFTDAAVSARRSVPVYYRLQQVDQDGQATYSQTVELHPQISTTPMSVKVYPNPMMDAGTISVSSPEAGTLRWQVFSIEGRVMAQGVEQVVAGAQTIPIKLTDWPAGTYYLKVNMGQQNQTISFVKPR